MTDKKRTSKNQEASSINKNEEASSMNIVPPTINSPQITSSKTGVRFIGNNVPPEFLLATLPQVSQEERKKLIEMMDNENERQFQFFSKKRNFDFCIKLIIIISIVGLSVFFTIKGKHELLKTLITWLCAAFGGGGVIAIYWIKKK